MAESVVKVIKSERGIQRGCLRQATLVSGYLACNDHRLYARYVNSSVKPSYGGGY